MKKIIDVKVINTARELQTILNMYNLILKQDEDEIYMVNKDGDPLILKLEKETLTDGSVVYNIVVE